MDSILSNEEITEKVKEFEALKNQLTEERNLMKSIGLMCVTKLFLARMVEIGGSGSISDTSDKAEVRKRFLTTKSRNIWLSLLAFQIVFYGCTISVAFFLSSLLDPGYSAFLVTGNYGYDLILSISIVSIGFVLMTYLILRASGFSWIWQSTCFYYSVSAAKSLENGDWFRVVSLLIEPFLLSSSFLHQEKQGLKISTLR